mmetsp:Transcript_4113/g.8392  ORF Transcript_4113/g.8392 Transcript_4113/m.8392 type:complete len:211 (+) Transcript_4113:24-656(+)
MEVELKDTLNKTWKEDKSGFGFRMMQKMGWKEDKGLGKNETGIVDNVKIAKRETGLGLGSKDIVDGANRGWSETATSFNAVLDVLKQSFSKKNDKKKSKVRKSAPLPTISVGMKYKKMREAKDMSTKTEAERRAILGSAMTLTSLSHNNSEKDDAFAALKKSMLEAASLSKDGDDSNSSSESESERRSKKSKTKKEKSKKKSKKEKKEKK